MKREVYFQNRITFLPDSRSFYGYGLILSLNIQEINKFEQLFLRSNTYGNVAIQITLQTLAQLHYEYAIHNLLPSITTTTSTHFLENYININPSLTSPTPAHPHTDIACLQFRIPTLHTSPLDSAPPFPPKNLENLAFPSIFPSRAHLCREFLAPQWAFPRSRAESRATVYILGAHSHAAPSANKCT